MKWHMDVYRKVKFVIPISGQSRKLLTKITGNPLTIFRSEVRFYELGLKEGHARTLMWFIFECLVRKI